MRVWKAMGEGRQKQRRLERWTGTTPQKALGACKGGDFILKEIRKRTTWENRIQPVCIEHQAYTKLCSRQRLIQQLTNQTESPAFVKLSAIGKDNK